MQAGNGCPDLRDRAAHIRDRLRDRQHRPGIDEPPGVATGEQRDQVLALVQALRLEVEDEPVDVVSLTTTEVPVIRPARPTRAPARRPAQA